MSSAMPSNNRFGSDGVPLPYAPGQAALSLNRYAGRTGP
jgi:hypothetical protein